LFAVKMIVHPNGFSATQSCLSDQRIDICQEGCASSIASTVDQIDTTPQLHQSLQHAIDGRDTYPASDQDALLSVLIQFEVIAWRGNSHNLTYAKLFMHEPGAATTIAVFQDSYDIPLITITEIDQRVAAHQAVSEL